MALDQTKRLVSHGTFCRDFQGLSPLDVNFFLIFMKKGERRTWSKNTHERWSLLCHNLLCDVGDMAQPL